MNLTRSLRHLLAVCGVFLLAPLSHAQRDGQHDFDFNLGTWETRIERNLTPLTGRKELIELKGVVRVRPVWNGKAMLEEIEADGPRGHWQAMTLFLYDPQAHQWSLSYASSAVGRLDAPMIGSFTNGRVELYQQDKLDGRAIFVRGIWSDITPTSHVYQEDYSDDGGKTWDRAFTARLTRMAS